MSIIYKKCYDLIEVVNSDISAISDHVTYICTASLNIDLPPASEWIKYGNRSIEITVMNQDGGGSSVTVTPYGSETINGASDVTLSRYHSVSFISDGTEIYIKSSFKHT